MSHRHISRHARAALCALGLLLATSRVAFATVIAGPTVNPANGHTYYLLGAQQWPAAEAEAATLGGHLATINDAAENAWVTTQFSNFGNSPNTLWIGFNDVAIEGTFSWTSGEPVTYTNWNTGEPNDSNGGEDHALIFAPDSANFPKWNDINTSNSTLGVVEVVPEPSSIVDCLAALGVTFAALAWRKSCVR